MRCKLGFVGVFKLKFTPVGVGALDDPNTQPREIILFAETERAVKPSLPCVKGGGSSKPICFKGFDETEGLYNEYWI